MSYFDNIVVPGATKTKKGYFDSIILPQNQEQANKLFEAQHQEQLAQEASRYENSFFGIAKNTAIDLGNKLVKVPIDFAESLYSTYSSFPEKAGKSITTGAEDFQKGKVAAPAVAGFRLAGDAAATVFAPISSAIGAVLNATGGTELLDKTGQVIADKSGITDIPAFQKFALENPEAGADFERLLNLALAGGEKGKINPRRITEEATVVANKLVRGESVLPERPKLTPGTTNPVQGTYFDRISTPEPVSVAAPKVASEISVPGPERAVNSRAVALDIAATKAKLTEGLGELPTHNRMNLSKQAELATEFIARDADGALNVAKGEILPPKGLLPESVYTALEIKAIREGNVNLIRELSQSKVPTLAGQSLKALDSVDPYSPVKILRDIQSALEAKVEKKSGVKLAKAKETEVKRIEKEIKATTSSRPTWESFIKSIECGY